VSEITDAGVVVKHKDGGIETIDADSVILSVGYLPAPVAKKSGKVHVIGDAAEVGNLRTVIWGAWDVCMKI
jgi:2-enoate reductase